jgi:hypothetical protein
MEPTLADKFLDEFRKDQFLGHTWLKRKARQNSAKAIIEKEGRTVLEFPDLSILIVEIKDDNMFLNSEHSELQGRA